MVSMCRIKRDGEKAKERKNQKVMDQVGDGLKWLRRLVSGWPHTKRWQRRRAAVG